MRYLALATDYDETLALNGQVEEATVEALKRARDAGHRLILVTGRHLDDIRAVFTHSHLFEWIVAENGGVIYHPASRRERTLAPSPPEDLVRLLRDQGVTPLEAGRVMINTWEPYGPVALEAIHALGLEYEVIFNKGAVMLLPSGVNKATGLEAALREMRLSPHNLVGVGDAENDHSFLRICEAAVAVANALPSLKKQADCVTEGIRGAGLVELIDGLITTDLRELAPRLTRHDLLLGTTDNEREVKLRAYGANLLVAGSSGGGKSTFVTSLLERMSQHCYQFCVIDPEGDYEGTDFAVSLGTTTVQPTVEEVLEVLREPQENVIVNLLAIPMEDRPGFFDKLFPRLQEMRVRTGRPHWIVVDEAHHMLPAWWEPAPMMLPRELTNIVLVTVQPDSVSPTVLAPVDLVIAVGAHPDKTIGDFGKALGKTIPPLPSVSLHPGKVAAWSPSVPDQLLPFETAPSHVERRRHVRKYARGDMGPESFYFRGPEGKLNLRAQNLQLFLQLAEGVDDATWLYHLHRGEYSRWFQDMVKDEELAAEAARIEQDESLSPQESRARIREAVENRYTAPA